jgi:hypothetical protein
MLPGQKGEKSCLCSGRIHKTNGDHFWILPHHDIDHPDAWKLRGSIFLDANDVCADVELRVGSVVVFYLFANERGLGAEACSLKSSFVMKLTEAPVWLLDDSDDEETTDSKTKAASDTNSTACASEEEASSEDEASENDSVAPNNSFDLPSKGSILHASGKCKPCGFFIWGCCTKGKDCGLCHCKHASRFECACQDSDSD